MNSVLKISTIIYFAAMAVSNNEHLEEGKVYRRSLQFNGTERTYRLYVPTSHSNTESLPLVVVLHGGYGDGEKIAKLTRFDQIAQREGFVVVYPDALNKHWNDGRGQNESVDDVGFLKNLIETLLGEFSLDRSKVYVTGASNGGMMTLRLACEITPALAAVAPVIASMPEPLAGKCCPTASLPILIINGENDPLVPWNGGDVRIQRRKLGRVISTPETVAFWVKNNGCLSKPVITYLPDRNPKDGSRVRVEKYSGPSVESEVLLYAVEGGGHTWPGGVQYMPEWLIGKTNRDFSASEEIWNFFKRHKRRSEP